MSRPARSVLGPATALPLVAMLAGRGRVRNAKLPDIPWWLPLVYVAVGAFAGLNLFLMHLPSLDSLFQAYDATQHLNEIQAMVDSGRYSSLGVSTYLSAADQAIDPTPGAGFYPSAWHIICAIVVRLTGAGVPIAINASEYVFAAVAFPLAMVPFLAMVFGKVRRPLVFGAVVCVSFVMFPWALLIFGPTYPNMAGFCVLPSALGIFMCLASPEPSKEEWARTLAAFVFSLVGLALLHPNTLFSAAVILIPFCASRLLRWSEEKHGIRSPRAIADVAIFLVACAGLWYACYRLPFFAGIVDHTWPQYARPFQEFVNILGLVYAFHLFNEFMVQAVLGLLVVVGIVRALNSEEHRWLPFSYLLICVIIMINATSDETLKHVLAGFWYTDVMRLSAVACIAAIPLAAFGFDWVYENSVRAVRRYNGDARETHSRAIAAVLVAGFVVINFMPSFDLSGLHQKSITAAEAAAGQKQERSVRTTFGDYREYVTETYSYAVPLSQQEVAFLKAVRDEVGNGSVVVNDPMDGSFLGYGITGVRCYYRNFVGVGDDNETAQSVLIRQHLNEISSNDEVRQAVSSIGAQYVMILNEQDSEGSFINLRKDYHPEYFSGISSITDDTPGFEVVLQDGPLRLYRITG